jgi:hypothetical protein
MFTPRQRDAMRALRADEKNGLLKLGRAELLDDVVFFPVSRDVTFVLPTGVIV